jgi:2-amino-4-hydroxy-6-hydroxymethyldihydropteridine diphosphokinase
MKHTVIIALGSNYLQTAHIHWASERLTSLLQDSILSRTLWTPDIKGGKLWYMNRLVRGTTTLSSVALQQLLKNIESETARTPQRVTLDLDLLLFDQTIYHEKDWQRTYVSAIINDVQ